MGHQACWHHQPLPHFSYLGALLPTTAGRTPCGSLRPPPAPEETGTPWQAHSTHIQVCVQAEPLLCPGSYGVKRACLSLLTPYLLPNLICFEKEGSAHLQIPTDLTWTLNTAQNWPPRPPRNDSAFILTLQSMLHKATGVVF